MPSLPGWSRYVRTALRTALCTALRVALRAALGCCRERLVCLLKLHVGATVGFHCWQRLGG